MKPKPLFLALLSIIMFSMAEASSAATRLVHEDFEAGANWNYSTNWDMYSSIGSNWTISGTSPHGGNYCAQSEETGGGILESSVFIHSLNTTWNSRVFIRFWLRLPVDWAYQATDSNGGANFLRAGSGAGSWSFEYNPRPLNFCHFYAEGRSRGTQVAFQRDNAWHEYAFLIQMPSSSTSADGIFRSWVDGNGTYTTANSLDNYTDVVISSPWGIILLPHYYKGTCSGNDQFWSDDIEIWDDLPSSTSDTVPPAAPTGLSVR